MNLLQDLRANLPSGMTGTIGIKPEGSKVDRMAAQSAKIEAGARSGMLGWPPKHTFEGDFEMAMLPLRVQ